MLYNIKNNLVIVMVKDREDNDDNDDDDLKEEENGRDADDVGPLVLE